MKDIQSQFQADQYCTGITNLSYLWTESWSNTTCSTGSSSRPKWTPEWLKTRILLWHCVVHPQLGLPNHSKDVHLAEDSNPGVIKRVVFKQKCVSKYGDWFSTTDPLLVWIASTRFDQCVHLWPDCHNTDTDPLVPWKGLWILCPNASQALSCTQNHVALGETTQRSWFLSAWTFKW